MEILHQLGHLFLQAAPTVVLVFLFYLFLRAQFFGPLQKAMAERSRRTEGARSDAQAAQAAAREKLDAYREALKRAQGDVYAQQEAERQKALDERAGLLREARSGSQNMTRAAKEKIAEELAASRAEVEAQTPALAGQIARAILERRAPGNRGEAR
jgi:F0F1-type ATP synthase membrane subunit b/b'